MMKTNCLCGGLLNPTVSGRLCLLTRQSVWFCVERLSFSVHLSWHFVLLNLSLVFSGMAQTVGLMDTLMCRLIHQMMNWASCLVTVPCQNISVPLNTFLFNFDAINFNWQTQAPLCHSPCPDLYLCPSHLFLHCSKQRHLLWGWTR